MDSNSLAKPALGVVGHTNAACFLNGAACSSEPSIVYGLVLWLFTVCAPEFSSRYRDLVLLRSFILS